MPALPPHTTLPELSTFAKNASLLPALVRLLRGAALCAELPRECRLAAVELLITVCEGAPKMCAKLPAFAPRVLGACNVAQCVGADGTLRFSGAITKDGAMAPERVLLAIAPDGMGAPTLRVNCDDGMASTSLLDYVKRALIA